MYYVYFDLSNLRTHCVKCIISGKTKVSAEDIQNTITDITETIKNKQESANETQTAKEKLKKIKDKINTLITFRQKLENDGGVQHVTALTETNNEIKHLENELAELIAKK